MKWKLTNEMMTMSASSPWNLSTVERVTESQAGMRGTWSKFKKCQTNVKQSITFFNKLKVALLLKVHPFNNNPYGIKPYVRKHFEWTESLAADWDQISQKIIMRQNVKPFYGKVIALFLCFYKNLPKNCWLERS